MAEGNSQLNNLLEENGASEVQSLVERVGDLSPLSPKEGDDSKGSNYAKWIHLI